jgi:hypothetical protein
VPPRPRALSNDLPIFGGPVECITGPELTATPG